MTPETDPHDLLRQVMNRRPIIESLAGGKQTQTELVTETGASQPTVSRTIRELRSVDLVREENGEYELTRLGRALLSKYRSIIGDFREISEASEVITSLPTDVSADIFLNNETVTSTKSTVPDNAIAPIIQLLPRASTIRACSTAIWTSLSQQISDRVVDYDLNAEIILAGDLVTETVLVDQEAALETGRLSLYSTSSDVPCDLSIIETPEAVYVAVLVRSEPGVWNTVVSKNEEAVEWVESEYRRIKGAADIWRPSPLEQR